MSGEREKESRNKARQAVGGSGERGRERVEIRQGRQWEGQEREG